MEDILLDENGDLKIENGDFVVGESTHQTLAMLLETEKGEIKEFPLAGVGLQKFLNSPDDGGIEKEVMIQMERDGFKFKSVRFTNGQLKINTV